MKFITKRLKKSARTEVESRDGIYGQGIRILKRIFEVADKDRRLWKIFFFREDFYFFLFLFLEG